MPVQSSTCSTFTCLLVTIAVVRIPVCGKLVQTYLHLHEEGLQALAFSVDFRPSRPVISQTTTDPAERALCEHYLLLALPAPRQLWGILEASEALGG